MSFYRSAVAQSASVTALTVMSLVLAACGGGGGTTSSPAPAPSPNAIPATAPAQDSVTGLRGACTSLKNGAAGYDVGYCLTTFQGGTFAEGISQNGPTTVAESSANRYVLSMPATWSSAAPISLYNGVDSFTTVSSNSLGVIVGGYGLDRTTSTNSVSLLDLSMSPASWGTPRLVNFGLWGYSNAATATSSELYYSGFAGVAPGGVAATGSTIPATASLTGVGGSWYLYNNSANVIPTGIVFQMAMSLVSNVSISGTTVTGTLSSFKSGATTVVITDVAFSATLNPSTGTFSGSITSGGTGLVKGAVYTNSTASVIQVAGQFAGKSSDGRVISGSFGAK